MDGNRFDRITKSLITSLPRREAVKALAAGGLAAAIARLASGETTAKKKGRRCRDQGQMCGGDKKCCGHKIKCQNITKMGCDHVTGKRCCGLEGAVCNNDADSNSHCVCCDGFYCTGIAGLGQCTSTPT